MDRRALPGLIAGLAGCASGVAGALLRSPVLTVLAAGCALVAGASSLALLDRARHAEHRATLATEELAELRGVELAPLPEHQSVVDPETGLPDGRFFEVVVESRVSAARRHLWPVTVILLEIAPGQALTSTTVGGLTSLLRHTLRESDVICRTGSRSFALLLEDTNEAGGVWAAERIQAAIAREAVPGAALVAGVASYPTHGLQPQEILSQARLALARAKTRGAAPGTGQVEVATHDPS
jgi:diguanylate cyclase (GGDEF)-like protein